MITRKTLAALAAVGTLSLLGRTAHGDLVAHWAFDAVDPAGATTPDSATGGDALAGTLVGDARLKNDVSDGVVTRASVLALDGEGDWVRIDHGVTTLGDGNSFSIAAWLKTGATSITLLGKGNADGVFQGGEKIFFIAEGYGGRQVGFVGHSQEWLASRSSTVNDGRWHHVAVTCDAADGAKRVYVDGRDVTTETSYRAGFDTGATIRIGATDWGDVDNFKGCIDDVAIFNEALSARQIRNVMRRGPNQFDALPEGIDFQQDLDVPRHHRSRLPLALRDERPDRPRAPHQPDQPGPQLDAQCPALRNGRRFGALPKRGGNAIHLRRPERSRLPGDSRGDRGGKEGPACSSPRRHDRRDCP